MRVAINGLGRIGRAVLKICLEKGINVVAVNDLMPSENFVYLMKHDSVYGPYEEKISIEKNSVKIKNQKILYLNEKNPEKLPWEKLKVDVVVESTGAFNERADGEKHIKAGAKKVVYSAPAKNVDLTVVPGVNDSKIKSQKHISVASCTTNCLAPVLKILEDKIGIKKAFMTTVHAYTASQGILDMPHKKMRRGRAGALNIVPTTSGATKAVAEVLPSLKNKIDGLAMRVPVPCGSIVDVVAELKKSLTKEELNKILKKSSETKLKGIVDFSEEELVSSDIIKDPHSAIIDSLSTQTIGNTAKILVWYDNEFGYSNRLVDVLKKLK